jgi:protein required for attachment to host cells
MPVQSRRRNRNPKERYTDMIDSVIPHDALVLVGDGRKALFLRNKGGAARLRFQVEDVLEQDNPSTSEQGTDQPGRAVTGAGTARSAMEETDWHRLAEDRFAVEIAEALYRRVHAGRCEKLVVVAPPKVLGEMRKAFHKEVSACISAEIPKELTSHPLPEIAKILAAL